MGWPRQRLAPTAKADPVLPWTTAATPFGAVVLPQEPYVDQPHNLLPVRPLVMWSYTDLSDPRFTIGAKYSF